MSDRPQLYMGSKTTDGLWPLTKAHSFALWQQLLDSKAPLTAELFVRADDILELLRQHENHSH